MTIFRSQLIASFVAVAMAMAVAGCSTGSGSVPLASQITSSQQVETPLRYSAGEYVRKFKQRGWTTRSTVRLAGANLVGILAKGMQAAQKAPDTQSDPVQIYVASKKNQSEMGSLQQALLMDIELASAETKELHHAIGRHMTSASAMPASKLDIRSLEKAILTSHQAKRLFAKAVEHLPASDVPCSSALAELEQQIKSLTANTDQLNAMRAAPAVG